MVLGRFNKSVRHRNAELNLESATIAAYLFNNANGWVPDLVQHETLADLPVANRITSQTLTNVQLLDDGNINADDVVYPSYSGIARGVVYYVVGADEASSFMLWADNESNGFPLSDSPANGVRLIVNTAGLAVL